MRLPVVLQRLIVDANVVPLCMTQHIPSTASRQSPDVDLFLQVWWAPGTWWGIPSFLLLGYAWDFLIWWITQVALKEGRVLRAPHFLLSPPSLQNRRFSRWVSSFMRSNHVACCFCVLIASRLCVIVALLAFVFIATAEWVWTVPLRICRGVRLYIESLFSRLLA